VQVEVGVEVGHERSYQVYVDAELALDADVAGQDAVDALPTVETDERALPSARVSISSGSSTA
jgi:hypothetical protein